MKLIKMFNRTPQPVRVEMSGQPGQPPTITIVPPWGVEPFPHGYCTEVPRGPMKKPRRSVLAQMTNGALIPADTPEAQQVLAAKDAKERAAAEARIAAAEAARKAEIAEAEAATERRLRAEMGLDKAAGASATAAPAEPEQAPEHPVGDGAGIDTSAFDGMSRQELLENAKELGIPNRAQLNKQQLAEAIAAELNKDDTAA